MTILISPDLIYFARIFVSGHNFNVNYGYNAHPVNDIKK